MGEVPLYVNLFHVNIWNTGRLWNPDRIDTSLLPKSRFEQDSVHHSSP